MKFSIERYGDGYRIILGSEIVGHALRMANGALGLFDTDDRRLTPTAYLTPSKALAGYTALQPKTGDQS